MKFWKLHGIGNDFIAIDGRFDQINPSDYTALAKKVCHSGWIVSCERFKSCRCRNGIL